MRKRAIVGVVGIAAALGGGLLEGVANAGGQTHWIGTTDNNSRVHGEVSADGGTRIFLKGSCSNGFWIWTDEVNNVSHKYLKTEGACWYGVESYWSETSG
ncbi:hypothetical protein [Streptoalloteichus hindustanus]|uniref:Uncharacterized protein n=1 Tax=Streptoalloteichus hindustanus TaxID=2017 RepID=A0A1M4YQP4_STRHI|nr:hypothetical protein [Streptoalloteichus hindustanus]SHF07832.1 hypothetical protein SAMN05444320_102441 [Streptoalloteichus hindustanus]